MPDALADQPDPMTATDTTFVFDNSYARLPERFFVRLPPTAVPKPSLIRLNEPLARRLGLDPQRLKTAECVEVFAGNRLPDGSEPLAMAYAGHQFGGWVPQLGDGRAILLGEVVGTDGVRYDIQLKGAGRTPFSRMGDGRAVLGPVLREYIVSEAMAGLGIPTTRSLAAVTTGEDIVREAVLPGAVLTRVAQSHVRVGTFQYFAARRDVEGLQNLADYVIDRHFREVRGTASPYRALLDAVIARQARLIAQWMGVGFIHGVMNTDNMSIAGETIDYGPCAFMDDYHPARVFSSIDHGGRYAFGNQPDIAHWNLACLARAILPILDADEATALEQGQAALDAFPELFQNAWNDVMRAKLGLAVPSDDDPALAHELLQAMAGAGADFTLTFRRLCDIEAAPSAADAQRLEPLAASAAFEAWLQRWRQRLLRETRSDAERRLAMRAVNPAFIARNHRVEEAISRALEGDLGPLDRLLGVLQSPFADHCEASPLMRPPQPDEIVQQTFCGT